MHQSFNTMKHGYIKHTFRPSGGSFVSLIELCNIDIGSGLSRIGGGSADKKSLQQANRFLERRNVCKAIGKWTVTNVDTMISETYCIILERTPC